ncbi:hypothetical protein HS125_04495 [bacterium]|nr:hypothetical protein [bacterium]
MRRRVRLWLLGLAALVLRGCSPQMCHAEVAGWQVRPATPALEAATDFSGDTHDWRTAQGAFEQIYAALVMGATVPALRMMEGWKGGAELATLEDVTAALHPPVSLASATEILSISDQQLALVMQAANYVFAGPASGIGNGYPSFRSLVEADIPETVLFKAYRWSGYATHLDDLAAAKSTLELATTYLPLTGGTISGNLTVSGKVTTASLQVGTVSSFQGNFHVNTTQYVTGGWTALNDVLIGTRPDTASYPFAKMSMSVGGSAGYNQAAFRLWNNAGSVWKTFLFDGSGNASMSDGTLYGGSSNFSGYHRLSGDSNEIYWRDNSPDHVLFSIRTPGGSTGWSTNGAILSTLSTWGTYRNEFTIKGGKVGINNTNPTTYLFEINGTLGTTGDSWFGDAAGDIARFSGPVYVGNAAISDDDYLYFDQGAEYLEWDDNPGKFVLSDDLDVAGDVTPTGTGKTWAAPLNVEFVITRENAYADYNGVETSSTYGFVCPGAGSIVGITLVNSTADLGSTNTYQIRKNGVTVYEVNPSSHPAGSFQDRGVDTFGNGDIISVYMNGTPGTGTTTATVWYVLDSLTAFGSGD